ncbi:hypothetical protein [Luteolibacter marinus]|uniref:hypothetical protein n=1 Tax=Luteolibacter marinus TaxID=2776705 RepID=UPI00186637E5|nr:hypothetical protein [Luteolibacter marinus]
MKTTNIRTVGAVGLVDWLKHSAPRYSLALGATCGCDISRLGDDICRYLNRAESPFGGHCRTFDTAELRHLAGDPGLRHAVIAAVAEKGLEAKSHCDFETMIRSVAALGGAVLPGQWALDSTKDLDNVFRVALSHCDHCCPESSLKLDPDGFSNGGLAAVIGKRFLRWCEDRSNGKPPHLAETGLLHAVG